MVTHHKTVAKVSTMTAFSAEAFGEDNRSTTTSTAGVSTTTEAKTSSEIDIEIILAIVVTLGIVFALSAIIVLALCCRKLRNEKKASSDVIASAPPVE